MIVNWTRDCIKGIPIVDEGRNVILAPGYNDVEDKDWKKVRTHVMDQLEQKVFVEEWVKVLGKDIKNPILVMSLDMQEADEVKPDKEYYIPSTLRDISRGRVVPSVVKKTWHIPTLKKWLKEEVRDDVIKAINFQVECVNNPSLIEQE